MKTKTLKTVVGLIALLAFSTLACLAAPLGTGFTYQGKLSSGTNAANGLYDLRFSLFDALTNGAQVGASLTNAGTVVVNGNFTVTLDFGGVFDGDAHWLEIGVRTNGAATFTTLAPRQPLAPVPYATYAPGAGTAAQASSVVAGSIGTSALAPGAVDATSLADNSVTAAKLASDAGSLAKVSAGKLTASGTPLSLTTDLYLGNHGLYLRGNPDADHGLSYNYNFGGTKVDGPVLFGWGGGGLGASQRGNGVTNLALIWDSGGNVGVGGTPSYSRLDVEGNLRINDNELLLRWGADADHGLAYYGKAGVNRPFAGVNVDGPVLYGYNGGALAIKQSGNNVSNVVLYWNSSSRVGINKTNPGSTLDVNGIVTAQGFSGSDANFTGDLLAARLNVGTGHTLSGNLATVAGGGDSTASGAYATVGGGYGNIASGNYATVPGGRGNTASASTSFAAGSHARAVHPGSFVWADLDIGYPPKYFDSTADDQFLIRARGGVGINNNAPESDLSVANGMNVDQNSYNDGTATNILAFGSSSGEGIGSQRAGAGNRFGLDFYTAYERRMSISQGGRVGIGTLAPTGMLEIAGDSSLDTPQLFLRETGASDFARLRLQGAPWAYWDLAAGGGPNILNLNRSDVGTLMSLGLTSESRTSLTLRSHAASFLNFEGDTGSWRLEGWSGLSGSSFNFMSKDRYVASLDGDGEYSFTAAGAARIGANSSWGQHIALQNSGSGMGTQPGIVYFRSGSSLATGNGFAWYLGGAHADGSYDTGGGYELMRLNYQVAAPLGGCQSGDFCHVGNAFLRINGELQVQGVVEGCCFNSTSDRNAKRNFAPVDSLTVLDKVLALPITTWNYANQVERHIGPMAQDFSAAFQVGPDDKHISSVDADGVALAALQGLNQRMEEKNAALERKLAEQQAEIQSLRQRLEAIEAFLSK